MGCRMSKGPTVASDQGPKGTEPSPAAETDDKSKKDLQPSNSYDWTKGHVASAKSVTLTDMD